MLWLKYFHVSCVTLSLCGFTLRAYWRLRAPHRLEQAWVRRAPHWVDTLLFASGLTMALLYWWPLWQQPWLLAKLAALLGYILAGALALRRGRPWQVALALGFFMYMVAVAVTKNPLPWQG